MANCTMLDTFPEFCSFWRRARDRPLSEQTDAWASDYLAQWPELLNKQQERYSSEGLDWRQVAAERALPFFEDRFPAMRVAHDNLLRCCESVYARAHERLGFDTDLLFVLYVGIGCGAGCATTLAGSPAILFGLEMIAECGWQEPPPLTGLVAHEIGHVAHRLWRMESGTGDGSGPWWDLYTEGFAQRCEHVILGRDTWHESTGINNADWLCWCREHKAWLASEFLRTVEANASVRPFFGSWFDIEGKKQCGYYLGHEVVKDIEGRMSLRDIGLLSEAEDACRNVLEGFVRGAA